MVNWKPVFLSLGLLFGGTALAGMLPDVNDPVRTGQKASNDAAVVISIEKYPLLDESAKIPYAHRDGDGMANFLLYTRGVPQAKMHRLQDKSATREQIEDAIEGALKEASGGTLWIYFAGHGAAASDQGQLLLGVDTPANDRLIEQRAVALNAIQQKIDDSNVEQAVIVIDACNASLGTRFAAPVSLSLVSGKKIAIWSAAGPGEKSGPLNAARHGAFTYAALGALRGWADGELGSSDGQVSINEAQTFVDRFLKSSGVRNQNPQLKTQGDFVLSKGVSEKAPQIASGSEADKWIRVSDDRSSGGSNWLDWTLGGVAVASIGTGVYFLVKAHGLEDDQYSTLSDMQKGRRTLSSARERWDELEVDRSLYSKLGIGLIALGGAVGVYDVIRIATRPEAPKKRQSALHFEVLPGMVSLGGEW